VDLNFVLLSALWNMIILQIKYIGLVKCFFWAYKYRTSQTNDA
jgi:hypothetical protein